MTEAASSDSAHSPEETYRLYIDESGDHVLKQLEDQSHRFLCLLGCWMKGVDIRAFHSRLEASEAFQQALTSSQLKLKPKTANIAGLQLADLLAHPARQMILRENGLISETPPPYAARLLPVLKSKLNRQLYTNKVEGYGTVLFPKK